MIFIFFSYNIIIGQNRAQPNLGPIGLGVTSLRHFLIYTARLWQDFEVTTQPSACLFVYKQDYANSNSRIFIKKIEKTALGKT